MSEPREELDFLEYRDFLLRLDSGDLEKKVFIGGSRVSKSVPFKEQPDAKPLDLEPECPK